MMKEEILRAIGAVRATSPLVHSITNYVVMNVTANALLAAHASPLMAHAPEELDDLTDIDSALVLNIGTLDTHWLESMEYAGKLMRAKGCRDVLNLDGGQTAVMVFMGKQINQIGAYDGGTTNSRKTCEVMGVGYSDQVGVYEVK